MQKCQCCSPSREYSSIKSLRNHERKKGIVYLSAYEKKKTDYADNPKSCLECSMVIPYEQIVSRSADKFCSRSCSAKFNNRSRIVLKDDGTRKRAPQRGYRPAKRNKICVGCSGPAAGKFCSIECSARSKRDKVVNDWLTGKIVGHIGKACELREGIRQWLLERANYSCSMCGWDERHPSDGLPLVEVDHIDGDAENSVLYNLRVLCPNCHSKTPTYRGRNRFSARIRN